VTIARRVPARGDRVGLLDLEGEVAVRAAGELRESGAVAIGAEFDISQRGAVWGRGPSQLQPDAGRCKASSARRHFSDPISLRTRGSLDLHRCDV